MANASRFYGGLLNLGADPDWNQVAKTLDLMRASDVPVVAERAVKSKDGSLCLPIYARAHEGISLAALAGASNSRPDPRRDIEELSRWQITNWVNVDPKRVGATTMGALVRLCQCEHDCEPTRASDLVPRPAPCTDANKAFEGLIGLEKQRALLQQIATLVAKHGREAADCLHMAFLGAPGTGKTELARRMLAHLDALGVTAGEGVFVKACAPELIGRFVGSTPARTRAALERARGGILFVDEAYALMDTTGYGQEAIDTLVEGMDDLRNEVLVVMAGYRDQMELLFDRNPGLRERLAFRVPFEDYATGELVAIFERMAAGRGFAVDEEARGEVARALEALRAGKDFANARTARRLLGRCLLVTASARDDAVVRASDVRAAAAEADMGAMRTRVGFA